MANDLTSFKRLEAACKGTECINQRPGLLGLGIGQAWPLIYCSFCRKSNTEVTKMITEHSACICNECVDLCHEIIH